LKMGSPLERIPPGEAFSRLDIAHSTAFDSAFFTGSAGAGVRRSSGKTTLTRNS